MGPAVTVTAVDPAVSKTADWPAATGGAPAGGLVQLLPRL